MMTTKVKITTVGSSAGIVLPKEILNRLKVKKGDTITLSETPYGFNMTAIHTLAMVALLASS
jgi:putative addiction module antidote